MEEKLYLVGDVADWIQKTLLELDCREVGDLSPTKCGYKSQRPLKEEIATMLCQSLLFAGKQNDLLMELQHELRVVKGDLISSQKRVIELQDQLLCSKDDQLQSLHTTVKTSVEDSVKAELLSYSDMVQKPTTQTLEPDVVKSLVKTVVEEEDRSRSVMVFGLQDEEAEDLRKKVCDVFMEIGEQPRVEASRLGKLTSGGKARPVKVSFSSSNAVNQVLNKARTLKQSQKYSNVFICPDRSPAQRAKHRQLVDELKKKSTEDPKHKHFIRRGRVVSADI